MSIKHIHVMIMIVSVFKNCVFVCYIEWVR